MADQSMEVMARCGELRNCVSAILDPQCSQEQRKKLEEVSVPVANELAG